MRGAARHGLIAVVFAIGGTVLGGCLGSDDEGSEPKGVGSINVAIVDNPQMQDLAHLTPSLFTAKSHAVRQGRPYHRPHTDGLLRQDLQA